MCVCVTVPFLFSLHSNFYYAFVFLVIYLRFKCAYYVSDYSIISRPSGIVSPSCCSCFLSHVEFCFLSVYLFIFILLCSVWWGNPFRAVSLLFPPEAWEVHESQYSPGG